MEPEDEGRTPPALDEVRLLPETTRDESGEGWGERGARDDDQRYLDDVPPHHGG